MNKTQLPARSRVLTSVVCLMLALACMQTADLYAQKSAPAKNKKPAASKKDALPKPAESQYAKVKFKWENCLPGIQHAYINHETQQIHVLKIDTKRRNLSFFVSPTQAKTQTTKAFLEQYKLVAAINANFFRIRSDGAAVGLAVNEGKVIAQPANGRPSFLIKKNGQKEVRQLASDEKLDDIQTAVSGDYIILQNGQPRSDKAGHHGGRHPRTSIGCSQDGRFVYFLVVDGRQKQSKGVPLSELAQWMLRVGAYQAINLDGGGSTTMVVLGKDGKAKVLNSPSDGHLRRVGNSIGIRLKARK